MGRYREITISKVATYSIRDRKSRVEVTQMARPIGPDAPFADFLASLPDVLSVHAMRELIAWIVSGKRRGKPVLLLMGAHVIKTGLSPLLIDLMEARLLDGIAMNGAGAIHDTELAYFGRTSEDVAEALKTGAFGMAKETGELLNLTIREGSGKGLGFGEALGERILTDGPPYAHLSLLAKAYRLEIPVTVHVALGTDIVHQHPNADGAAIGETSLRDFRIFADLVSRLDDGGTVLLFGSAVVLPEVFLKALTVARNVCGRVKGFSTACFDMIRHYRPLVNVVERPTQHDGHGYQFVGQHEILIPLFVGALKAAWHKERPLSESKE